MNNQIGIGKILIGAVVIAVVCVAGLIGARMIIAPSFAAVDGDYRYQWHRSLMNRSGRTSRLNIAAINTVRIVILIRLLMKLHRYIRRCSARIVMVLRSTTRITL